MRADMNCVRFFLDYVITVLFFAPMHIEKKVQKGKICLGFVCLLLTLPMYLFIDLLTSDFLRFMLKVFLFSLYIRCTKGSSTPKCLYAALLCWLTFNMFTSTFLTPRLYPYFFVHTIQEITVGTVLSFGIYFFGCLAIGRALMLQNIQPNPYSVLFMLILCCIEVYIKRTLNSITRYFRGPDEFTVYLVLLQLLFGLLIVVFERNVQDRAQKEKERVLAMTQLYSYKAALSSHNQGEEARRLCHDMKNHLAALCGTIEKSQCTDQYLSKLMEDLTAFEVPAYTGNPILDGLLAHKNAVAQKNAIDFTVQLGKWPDGILQDTDITVILGNLLDNAIDASKKIPDSDMRAILLKTVPSAGHLCIVISNYYTGEISWVRENGQMPATTKQDTKLHGIGLSSVKHALDKYDGALSLELRPEKRFVATVFIP